MIDKIKMEANEPSAETKTMTTFKEDFESVYNIISVHRNRLVKQINGESIMMAWEVGGFVSGKLKHRLGVAGLYVNWQNTSTHKTPP